MAKTGDKPKSLWITIGGIIIFVFIVWEFSSLLSEPSKEEIAQSIKDCAQECVFDINLCADSSLVDDAKGNEWLSYDDYEMCSADLEMCIDDCELYH
jgi:hypothetical protein